MAALEHLFTWLMNEKTNLTLAETIIARLTAWHSGDPLTQVQGPRAIREAVQEQDRIGWENFLLGRMSKKFLQAQQAHYSNLNSQKTGNSWATKLIRQGWLMVWKMWEHRNHINTSTLAPQQRRERGHLLTRVRQEFAKGKSTLLKEDHYLLEDRRDTLKYTLEDLRDWLDWVHHARAANARHLAKEARSLRASQRCLTRWLAQHPDNPRAD